MKKAMRFQRFAGRCFVAMTIGFYCPTWLLIGYASVRMIDLWLLMDSGNSNPNMYLTDEYKENAINRRNKMPKWYKMILNYIDENICDI